MNRDGHNNVTFFVGPEVEHTPAFCKKTLFVVDYQSPETVEAHAKEQNVQHVFLGANHSFHTYHVTDYFIETWNNLITRLLDKGYWVTLDYPAHQHQTVLKMLNPGIWQSRLFVPLLSVRIPKIETSSPNLTVKIDDIDFKATNPGVWCMSVREVTDSNRFTDWTEYSTDVVIKTEEIPPATQVQSDVKNDASLGLDPDSKSMLKPETLDELVAKITPENVHKTLLDTPAAAAEAYAAGATQDPLANKPASKKTSAKKA
jgi:hypothetical protein